MPFLSFHNDHFLCWLEVVAIRIGVGRHEDSASAVEVHCHTSSEADTGVCRVVLQVIV
jgi:hypothetical protein